MSYFPPLHSLDKARTSLRSVHRVLRGKVDARAFFDSVPVYNNYKSVLNFVSRLVRFLREGPDSAFSITCFNATDHSELVSYFPIYRMGGRRATLDLILYSRLTTGRKIVCNLGNKMYYC